jgi:ribosome biogenesis protein Nip4
MEDLHHFCQKIGVDTPEHIVLKKQYFEVSPEIKQVLDQVPFEAQYAGKLLGSQGRGFTPSLDLLEYAARNGAQTITVDEKTAFLFTCGRDILQVQVRGFVIVLDFAKRVLGYGKGERGIVKNLWDVGDYLRREKK